MKTEPKTAWQEIRDRLPDNALTLCRLNGTHDAQGLKDIAGLLAEIAADLAEIASRARAADTPDADWHCLETSLSNVQTAARQLSR